MAKRRLKRLSRTGVSDTGAPTSKTGAAKKWITDNPEVAGYSEIIAGVKSAYGFDLKSADVANAKMYLKKAGKGRRKKVAKATIPGNKTTASGAKSASSSNANDVVSATLKLVEAVGLEQARAIISNLGR